MGSVADRLLRALRTAGVQVMDVALINESDKRTWRVSPANLQAAAQATIDAFNPDDPLLDAAELDEQVKAALDNERLISAVVWAILDTYAEFKPATPAKYQSARTKIIAAYKAQPWKT